MTAIRPDSRPAQGLAALLAVDVGSGVLRSAHVAEQSALEDLQLPQAGYGLRLSMARKRLSRPLTGAACFAIFRHE